MKSLYKILSAISLLFISVQFTFAQIDIQCNGRDLHSIYIVGDTAFYRVDSVDTNPTDTIWVGHNPANFGGISINPNLDSAAGPETMYYVNAGFIYYFWNGSGWSNTGHIAGGLAANPGGSSNYIFNLDGVNGDLYRYDGTGNGTLLLSNLNTNGTAIWDVAVDNTGNFYLFYTIAQKIYGYTANGIAIDTFTTTGIPTGNQPGFAILGNRMYALINGMGIYEGILSGTTINFTLIKNISIATGDIAACPEAGNALGVFADPLMPHFAVCPNPARDFAIIRMDNTSSLQITDCMGRIKENTPTRGLTELQIPLSGWKPGVYFINATSINKKVAHSMLVVQ